MLWYPIFLYELVKLSLFLTTMQFTTIFLITFQANNKIFPKLFFKLLTIFIQDFFICQYISPRLEEQLMGLSVLRKGESGLKVLSQQFSLLDGGEEGSINIGLELLSFSDLGLLLFSFLFID